MTNRLRPGRWASRLALAALLTGSCTVTQPRSIKPPATPTKLQTSLAVDKAGNQILVGTFAATVSIAGATLHSTGGTDIFVAKLKPDGTPAWPPRRYGGAGDDAATSVTVDAQDNIILGGSFQGELALGATRLLPQFRSPDLYALFVAKLDATGKELWLKQVGVADGPSSVSVAATPDGKITVGAGVVGKVQKDGKVVDATWESVLLQSFGPDGQALPTPNVQLRSLDSGPCTHSPCQQGAKLVSGCDWCVQIICNLDSYCCSTFWDAQCVGEVASDCGQRCNCSTICTTGNPFNSLACPCTNAVCAADSFCCRWSWDATCVSEVFTFCGMHCP